MKKRVLLIGGRRKARSLAVSLLRRGYQVTAVNENHEDCLKLAEIDRLTVIEGDGSKPSVLEDADAGTQDIAIALTSRDEDNLVICELCKKRFHVIKTVTLVSDPQKTEFFTRLGVDRVVCAISAITGIIEQQAFMERMETAVPIGTGRVQITEISIPSDAPVAGKALREIDLPKETVIGCILRGEAVLIPRGDTVLLAGDLVVLIAGSEQAEGAARILAGARPC